MTKIERMINKLDVPGIRILLAENRKAKGVSIAKVAAVANVTSQTVRNVEDGKTFNGMVVAYELALLDDDTTILAVVKRLKTLCENYEIG